MSIRKLLATLLTITLLFIFGAIFFSSRLLENHIISLLPPNLAPATSGAIHFLVFEQFLLMVVIGSVLSFLIYWIVGSMIAAPLSKVVKAMKIFATDATLIELPQHKTVGEICELEEVFIDLAHKVQLAHKKDEDISRVKSDFISTAAHQLRTPLTGIRWALEALEKENITEDQRALVKNAVDKSHDLVAIVGTLLDISSIESGKYKYTFTKADISTVISGVTHDLAQLSQQTHVALFYGKESALPDVRMDADRIKWILNNLVENAIRYTPAQGTVRLTTDFDSSRVYVRVSDTGIGIQEKDRANIFERFYRAGNAIAKENQGNGLGLYIARTIATDHGGDLTFTANTKGPGTTFVLSLPIAV
jgi:signal transduction histidine kinase